MMDQSSGVILNHLDHMRMRNLSPRTITSRRNALRRLSRWAGHEPILYLSEQQVATWQAERSRAIRPGSLRGEMVHVRGFYAWAVFTRLRDDDPTARLFMPRIPRPLPRPMADDHIGLALASAPPDVHRMLVLAGFAGLRAAEIAQLDWRDVGLDNRIPTVRIEHGKGDRTRIVPISSGLANHLRPDARPRGPVVPRRDGKSGHVQPWRVSAMANDHLHSIGLDETLHSLRHRFGTVTYAHSKDVFAVQRLLGHASPNTTQVYVQIADAIGEEAVEAAGELELPKAA